jgi:hypothetical protein
LWYDDRPNNWGMMTDQTIEVWWQTKQLWYDDRPNNWGMMTDQTIEVWWQTKQLRYDDKQNNCGMMTSKTIVWDIIADKQINWSCKVWLKLFKRTNELL